MLCLYLYVEIDGKFVPSNSQITQLDRTNVKVVGEMRMS